MTSFHPPKRIGLVLLALAATSLQVTAQEENERLSSNIPLENSIANRDVAVRWRAEVQDTEDNSGLISEDPALAYYPRRMYTTELKMFTVKGATASAMYDEWVNDQGLDVFRTSGGVGVPVGEAWRVDGKASYFDREGYPDTQFYYLSAGRPVGNFYTYTQYRLSLDGKNENNEFIQGHQGSEYLSWTPIKTFRLGGQGAYCNKENEDDSAFGRLFTAMSFFDYQTAIRLEVLDYESRLYTDYREYKAYLYQKLTTATLLRFQYRYYSDDAHQESHGPGVKVIHYFCPRICGQLGYVHYTQREGPDFDSFLGGMSVIF
jgi:hypothetical protein